MLQFSIIFILILYVLYLPVRVKVKGDVDVEAGIGNASFSVFYIPVFRVKSTMEKLSSLDSDLILSYRKKQTKMHISVNEISPKKVVEFFKKLDLSFLSNLDVREISLHINYGGNSAFWTTFLLGTAKILFYNIAAVIKCNQKVEISESFVPEYKMRTLKVDFHGIFSLSIADIIYGFMAGKLKKFRRRHPLEEAV